MSWRKVAAEREKQQKTDGWIYLKMSVDLKKKKFWCYEDIWKKNKGSEGDLTAQCLGCISHRCEMPPAPGAVHILIPRQLGLSSPAPWHITHYSSIV